MKCFEVDTICRLCLRADEKVFKLNNSDQKVFIESIIKIKQENYVPTHDLYICYICNALLKKSFNFMKTIWRAQKLVCAILKNNNMVTKQLVYRIDRHNAGLNPITLSTAVAFLHNVKRETSEYTSSDNNTMDLLITKEKPRKQNNPNMNKIDYYSKNINYLNRISDEYKKSNIHEFVVDIRNNLEIDCIQTESSDPLTKELIKDKPIPETKIPVMKKNKDLEKRPSNKNKVIVSIGDEDEETQNNILDEMEIEICNSFEIDGIKTASSDPLTKEFNTDACDEAIPKTKKTVIKKISDFEEKSASNANKLIVIISDDDDDDDKSVKCIADEMELKVCNNLEIDGIQTKSSYPLTKELNTDACDEPIPKKTVRKKKSGLKKNHNNTDEKKRKIEKKDSDYDYQPDSTSHSEDSDYDSYDDAGKPIKRPEDNRVFPMKCDHCDYEVQVKNDHYRHYQYTHPNIEYPYSAQRDYACSICGKLFSKLKIGTHEAGHAKREIKCKLCPKVCSNNKKMHAHVARVHPRKTFTCDYCSKIFKTKSDLLRHIRTHTGFKPYKCHICGDGFAHSGNRIIHIRSKHQNYKCASKVRRNKKHCSTDTEISANSEETVQSKTIRRSNKQSETTEVTLNKKRKSTKHGYKNKKGGGADTAMVRTESKNIRKNKENRNGERTSRCTTENKFQKRRIESDDSDDETLAVVKSKNT